MAYVVDVNNPAEPINSRGAGQAAEELRAIKLKISSLTRDSPSGNLLISKQVTFSGAFPQISVAGIPGASAVVPLSYIEGLIAAAVPAGAILMFGMLATPAGWLRCNGQAVSRVTYATLFSRIGTTHGAGDGTTTFNVPDIRGYVPRGLDEGRGIDAGRALGSLQADQNKAHTHFIANNDNVFAPRYTLTATTVLSNLGGTGGDAIYHLGGHNPASRPADSGLTSREGGTEARMKNIAFPFCIKT